MMVEDVLPYLRLQLNVQYPALEGCWQEGYEAAEKENTEHSNPYPEGSVEFKHWSDGWWAANYGEQLVMRATSQQASITPLNAKHMTRLSTQRAANEDVWEISALKRHVSSVAKIAGAIAATVVVGYGLVELVD